VTNHLRHSSLTRKRALHRNIQAVFASNEHKGVDSREEEKKKKKE